MKKEETRLPHIDPAVTNPAAIAYAQSIGERRYRAPVGGGPSPSIPRLDTEAASGMTMADQAYAARQPAPSGFFEAPMNAPSGGQMSRPPPNILPNDMLPEAALSDPAYREGSGSRYASSQPQLAFKYGVIRNKQMIPPQQLQTGTPGLSKETVEGLKAVQEANRTRAAAESMDHRVETDAASGPAGAAARLGNTDENVKPTTAAERERTAKAIESMDDFDFNTFREMMMKDIINNEDQKKIIESRLIPMDVTELITNRCVRQVVPIIPGGKFEPEFQSMAGDEDLALKRLVMAESKSIDVNSRYLLDKFSIMSLAVGLYAVNKNPFPDHRDANGAFDDTKFWVKFNKVIGLPFHMLASLGVNYFWFDIRVRKLFVAEQLGNG